MIRFDFWLAIILVWAGATVLVITASRFLKKEELRDKVVAIGLICISIALFLNGLFYLFYLFTGLYWTIVEILHIMGAILITLGILNIPSKKKK